jgi:aminoglycoside phosphotransferase (APT) family kinase protein
MTDWLRGRSVAEVRRGLASVSPELADLPIVLHGGWIEQGNPSWDRSTAFVGDDWVVKFAWSAPAATKLEREIAVLRALATMERPPPVRRVHTWSSDPVMFVAPFVAGSPVLGDWVAELDEGTLRHLAQELAQMLAKMHSRATLTAVERAGVTLPPPTPQADTDALRTRFVPMLDERHRALVTRWCAWVDDVLDPTVTEPVILHGDFHGYNVVVDRTSTVRAVLDLEEASLGDHHYDFRYLPAQAPTVDLFLATVNAYEPIAQRSVAVDRVMGWHIRTVLGDALWRSEARVALPGGGTAQQWIEELDLRMAALELDCQ